MSSTRRALTFGGAPAAEVGKDPFYEWATRRAGVKAVGCEPAEVAEGWRGVVATKTLAKGDCVLRVPGDILMSHRSAAGDPDLAVVLDSPEGHALTPADRLAVHLLHEASKGESSRWHLYIEQLPRTYNLLCCFTAAERALLQAPFAIDAAERSAEHVESAWKRASEAMRALALPSSFRTLPAWRWAHSTISSRTVFVPFDSAGALCPVGDLFNYAPPPTPPHFPRVLGAPFSPQSILDAAAAGDSEGGEGEDDDDDDDDAAGDGSWDEASGEYRFYVRRAHRPGEQIMLCYGRYTNLQLLEHYGFMLPHGENPHDVAPLPGPLLRAAAAADVDDIKGGRRESSRAAVTARRSRREASSSGGVAGGIAAAAASLSIADFEQGMLTSPRGELDWTSLETLRLAAFARRNGAAKPVQREAARRGEALGPAAEGIAFAAVRDAAATVLLGLPTTAKDDVAMLQQNTNTSTTCTSRCSVDLREEEKKSGEEEEEEEAVVVVGGVETGVAGAEAAGAKLEEKSESESESVMKRAPREWLRVEEENNNKDGEKRGRSTDPALPGLEIDSNGYLAVMWRIAYKRAVQSAYKLAAARVEEAEKAAVVGRREDGEGGSGGCQRRRSSGGPGGPGGPTVVGGVIAKATPKLLRR